MRVVRALAGALLWIVASVLSLIAVILCVTIILLPLGIPLLKLGGRMYGYSMKLFLPRELSHPVDAAKDRIGDSRKSLRKAWKKGRKAVA